MKKHLMAGDQVRYRSGKRRMRGTVMDYLPMPGLGAVPVLLRRRVVWMERQQTRKLPAR